MERFKDQLKAWIKSLAGNGDLLEAVFTAVDLFQYGNKAEDDMTLMVVKVTDENA